MRSAQVAKIGFISAGSGVNIVHTALSVLSMRLLSFVHVCICFKYVCMYVLASFLLACADVMAMSSAYEVSLIGIGGVLCIYVKKCGREHAILGNACFKLALF